MRLHRLTADGPVQMQLTLAGGELTVEQGPPGGPMAVIETIALERRIEREVEEEGQAMLDAKVAELKSAGAVVPIVPDEAAKAYFDGPFFARLEQESKKRKKPLELLAPLEARYGCRFPDDLRRLFTLVETHAALGFGEWTNLGGAFTPFKENKNLLEQAIDLDRKNYLGTAIRELLSCLVPIGYAGNGDVYFAFVDAARFEGCEIFLWDHEEQSLGVFADSLSSLAYLNHLYEIDAGRIEVEGDVLDATRAGLQRLEKRVKPSWHYRALCENAGVELSYQAVTGAESLYYRATWVHVLLRNKGAEAAVQAKACVGPHLDAFHRSHPFSSYRESLRLKRSPAFVYWLFQTYFFDDAAGFAEAVDVLASSASTFTRDAAALFAPLRDAKPKTKVPLGKITDAAALKKSFLKAETGAARTARLQAEKEAAESARAGLLAEADAIAKGASAERLFEAIQESKARPVVVERLYEHLAALDPEISRAQKRLEVLADSGRYREHRITNTWLMVHATRRIVPLAEARGMKGALTAMEPPVPAPAPAPPEVTRDALLPLRTESSRKLQVALAGAGTEAHLALLDELLATRRGASVFIVFERLMREAIANRLGKPVDLDVVRRALGVTYSDRDRTDVLHRTALTVLAAQAPKDEVRATALRFMTWDLPEVRRTARRILVEQLGEPDRTRIIDGIEAEEMVAAGGVEALRAALRDPWAYPKVTLVELARERGLGEAIADDAIAAFKATYAPFVEGHGYYSGNYEVMLRTARAIAAIPGANVDAFIHFLVTSRSPLLSPAIDDASTKDRARKAGALEQDDDAGPLSLASFSAPPFVIGGTVHGIAKAGGHIVAAGPRCMIFDERGRGTPLPAEVRFGFAHDVDVDPEGKLAAVGYHACHLVILDVAKNEVVLHLQLGGVPSGIRKVKFSPSGRFVATASDDETVRVVDLTARAEVLSHREPYDVNGVAWLDDEQVVFITDHHVGVLPRAGGEPRRIDVGGGADVIVHEGKIVATTAKHGIAWIDPPTMKIKRKLAQKSVARVRIAADGTVWAAVYEGEYEGLVCFPPGENAVSPITGESMFGLHLDESGAVMCGGKAGRIHHVTATGEVQPPPEASHTGGVVGLELERSGETVLSLDATGRVLRWSLAGQTAVAPWGSVEPMFSPHTARETSTGDLILGAFKKTARLGGGKGETWQVDTERSEALLVFGDQLALGDGNQLHWLDAKTGQSLAKVPAGVKSSWIAHLFALDDDAFLVAGYDDPKLARWSATKRAAEQTVAIDRRHEDGRYSRVYGMTLAPRSRRLYTSAWNETVDVIDPRSFELLMTYDVAYSYEWLAVDDDERWLLLATSTVLDLVDLRTGARVARRTTPAPISSLVVTGPSRALVGLASGELLTATWT